MGQLILPPFTKVCVIRIVLQFFYVFTGFVS